LDEDETGTRKTRKRYKHEFEREEARKRSREKWYQLKRTLQKLLKRVSRLGDIVLYQRDENSENVIYVYTLPNYLDCYVYYADARKLTYLGKHKTPDDARTFRKE
jgi:hypothetical protein